jgi:hypothetical protein
MVTKTTINANGLARASKVLGQGVGWERMAPRDLPPPVPPRPNRPTDPRDPIAGQVSSGASRDQDAAAQDDRSRQIREDDLAISA